jgi:hypothetical protein
VAMALSEEHAVPYWVAAAHLAQGYSVVPTDPERAVALIERGRASLASYRTLAFQPSAYCVEAEALMRLGRYHEARGRIEQGFELAERTGVRWWTAEMHRTRAALTRAENGDIAAIRDDLVRAVEIAEGQGAEMFRYRAANELRALDGR